MNDLTVMIVLTTVAGVWVVAMVRHIRRAREERRKRERVLRTIYLTMKYWGN